MKKWRLFGKIVVLACSVLLLGGYVFVRAGGRLWPAPTDSQPPVPASLEQERVFFSGSKSLQLGPALSVQPQGDAPPADEAQRGVIMGGSKSRMVFEPAKESPEEAARRFLIMAGSKSAIVFEPANDAPAPNTPAAAQPTAPQRSVIMGGSKSEVIVLPPPPQPQSAEQKPSAQGAQSQRSQP